jgi:MFS family permease
MARLGPGFGRLWTASALSNLADGVFQVALPRLAVTLTKSPARGAGVALAQRLPWLLMALPAGALADRLDRRRTMVRVDLLRVAVMTGLATTVALDVATMPSLYVAALVLGAGETLFDTASQSILPAVVGRHQLSVANGRLQAVELTTNQFIGPPLGGLLAAAALTVAFAASAGAYLLAAVSLMAIAGSFRHRLLGWGTMPIGAAIGGAVAEWAGLRTTFVVASLMHVPLLQGFLVVTEPRIAAAEAAGTVDP